MVIDFDEKVPLASKGSEDHVLIAEQAYYKGDWVKSADFYLKAFRVSESKLGSHLQTELESHLY